MRNEPNFPAAPAGRGLGDVGRGRNVRNEPNLEGGLCKTNPISRLGVADRGQTCRLRPAQADCAKQSQFPDGWKGTRAAGLPVPPVGAIMRNKANSRTGGNGPRPARVPLPLARPAVQTKPICGGAGWERPQGRGARANRAKRSQFAVVPGGTGPPGAWDAGQTCETNPIFARTARAKGRQGRLGRRWDPLCETKPISSRRPTPWIWNRRRMPATRPFYSMARQMLDGAGANDYRAGLSDVL